MVAFGFLSAKKELKLADGLVRIASVLLCEFFAYLGVWVIMELDVYNLINVVYRFSLARIGTLVFAVVAELAGVHVGNEMAAMVVACAVQGAACREAGGRPHRCR